MRLCCLYLNFYLHSLMGLGCCLCSNGLGGCGVFCAKILLVVWLGWLFCGDCGYFALLFRWFDGGLCCSF